MKSLIVYLFIDQVKITIRLSLIFNNIMIGIKLLIETFVDMFVRFWANIKQIDFLRFLLIEN